MACAAAVFAAGTAAGEEAAELGRFAFERPYMATLWRVTLYAPGEAEARSAAEAAFARIGQLERVMSDYDPGSEVRSLGVEWRGLSGELFDVLDLADEIGRASGGAFDVGVGPVVRVWKRAIRRGELPRPELLEKARAASGAGALVLDRAGRRARLAHGDARVDLGGIGKGFALDRALAVVRDEHGFRRVLVDAGGDVIAGDPPPGKTGWTVSVHGNGEPWTVTVAGLAVATSGDLHQHAEIEGRRVAHLVDPRTGQALGDGAAATVIGRSAAVADALASALCVLEDGGEGRRLAESYGVEARVSRGAGGRTGEAVEVWETAGLAALEAAP